MTEYARTAINQLERQKDMYVRVIDTKNHHNHLYDCIHAGFIGTLEADEENFFLHMERHNASPVYVDIDKKANEVYFMNDQGQTIDSYRWPSLQES